MAPSCVTPTERARKGATLVLQRLQEPGTQSALAVAMGCSEAQVSRIKNAHLDEVLLFLAHLGIKLVPVDHTCVAKETYEFLTRTHARVMQQAPQLIWEADA